MLFFYLVAIDLPHPTAVLVFYLVAIDLPHPTAVLFFYLVAIDLPHPTAVLFFTWSRLICQINNARAASVHSPSPNQQRPRRGRPFPLAIYGEGVANRPGVCILSLSMSMYFVVRSQLCIMNYKL